MNRLFNLSSLLVFALSALAPTSLRATTYWVTTTADSGPGSLRQAVLDANATTGPHTINFNIPGPGPYAIRSQSALPLASQSITVKGQSQPNVNAYGGYVYVFDAPTSGLNYGPFSLDSYIRLAPVAVLPPNGIDRLGEAVDQPSLVWVNDPLVPWLLETTDTHDGISAAVSNPLGKSMSTHFSTTVQGPLQVSFWWKARPSMRVCRSMWAARDC